MVRRGLLLWLVAVSAVGTAQEFHPSIPKAWSDNETTSFELPLAQADRSPKYPSAKEYYDMPVRPVYRTYPFYAPDKEPAGYWESLQQKEPEILFDPVKLVSKEDWIRAGELVFEEPILFATTRDRYLPEMRAVPGPMTQDGIIPFYRYVIRRKGVVELGVMACSSCHTRVLADGTLVRGAQGNYPMDQSEAWRNEHTDTTPARAAQFRNRQRINFAAPWAENQDDPEKMNVLEVLLRYKAMPPGVTARFGASTRHPVRIPSLIGIEDLKYLDATGDVRHRSIADLMRYAIVNQGLNLVAHFGDFQPAPHFVDAQPSARGAGLTIAEAKDLRYSDEQLYALALYLNSLKPPPNPNPFNADARRGQSIFNQQGCANCHPAPLYTNNKLAPVDGFKVPDSLRKTDAILDFSVGSDPGLALETRRGTGFYKVPSLRGVWMRSAFGHGGQAASLEEWFDPTRLSADYLPKGFHLAPGPIQGHQFGIRLPVPDRRALVAFLKTL